MSNGQPNLQLEALRHFKDWSNYLLVTTVISLGWVSTGADLPFWAFSLSVGLLATSVVFAIFTLALIPHVAENIEPNQSIYSVKPEVRPLLFFSVKFMTIKWVCWPQHVLFVLGILVYALGSICSKFPA
jgi:hypothetical protein